ncbi:hypothetical protein MMC31_003221, partial [Peltigera leucophlebia]|nr:hypothetical protein [Peltigera leucophlebia]
MKREILREYLKLPALESSIQQTAKHAYLVTFDENILRESNFQCDWAYFPVHTSITCFGICAQVAVTSCCNLRVAKKLATENKSGGQQRRDRLIAQMSIIVDVPAPQAALEK